jgi:hypothetical protein
VEIGLNGVTDAFWVGVSHFSSPMNKVNLPWVEDIMDDLSVQRKGQKSCGGKCLVAGPFDTEISQFSLRHVDCKWILLILYLNQCWQTNLAT